MKICIFWYMVCAKIQRLMCYKNRAGENLVMSTLEAWPLITSSAMVRPVAGALRIPQQP